MIHSGGFGIPGVLSVISSNGARGVQLFFVISGYLAFASLQHTFPNNKKVELIPVMKWYVKKFIRLFPLYYISILISMFTETWSAVGWLGTEEHVTFKNILAHVFFIHGLFPHYTDSILGVDWYIGVLALFYLITPLIYKHVSSLEKSCLLLIIVQVVTPLANEVVCRVLPVDSDPSIYNAYRATFGPINHLFVYCLGFTLFYIVKRCKESDSPKKKRTLIAYELFVFSLIMLAGQFYSKSQLFLLSTGSLWGIWFFILILSQSICACPIIDNPFFRLLGKYSYGMYLFQYIWIANYDRFITVDTQMARFAISLIGLLLISILFTKFIDQPFQRFLNKRIFKQAL